MRRDVLAGALNDFLKSACSPSARETSVFSFSHSYATTARMAPNWIEISALAATSPVNPNAWPAKIKWPVDETGRNSVSPSTMPRITARAGPHSFMRRP
jgi:hypothetical protein